MKQTKIKSANATKKNTGTKQKKGMRHKIADTEVQRTKTIFPQVRDLG